MDFQANQTAERQSGDDRFEPDLRIAEPSQVGFDLQLRRRRPDSADGAGQVPFHSAEQIYLVDSKEVAIEPALLVGDQDEPRQLVQADEEFQMGDGCLLFTISVKVAGKAGGAARDGETVVPV